MLIRFIHPSTFLLAGPTGSGKTHFVCKVLTDRLINPFPSRIIWIYSEWQDSYDRISVIYPYIEFIKGPITEQLYESIIPTKNNLLILDDQMTNSGKKDEISKLFTQGSHHKNLSVMYLVQNLFDKGKQHRTVSLNSHYIILFKNPRDNIQPGILGRQMYTSNWKAFVEIYKEATNEPYGYIVLDLRQETPDDFRIRSNIFKDDTGSTRIYLFSK